jgi:alpha-amylase
MKEIFNRVHGNPYVFHEVLDYGSEPIKGHEYYNTGDVTEFRYSAELNRMFKYEPIKHLKTFGQSWGLRDSKRALVFVDNHDSQRGHGAGGDPLTFKDQALYVLANVFMLAHPYGNARVMSSYQFNDGSQGPPSHSSGRTKRVWTNGQANCYGEWVCEHRWLAIANMVQFRKVSNGKPLTNWWDNGNRQIAFGRGSKGFVVINREGRSLQRAFQTGLAQGWYCNVTAGNAEGGQCSGDSVYVDHAGRAEIKVMPMASVAIHVGAKVSDSAQ